MLVPFVLVVFALVALIATLSVTEMVRVFAHRLSAVDTPGGRRIHRRPTARLGGPGIYWGFYVALALYNMGEIKFKEQAYPDAYNFFQRLYVSFQKFPSWMARW